MRAFPLTRLIDQGAAIFLILLAAFAVAIPVFNLLVPPTSSLHISTYLVALFGKYICYALLALSIDLIWGYAGILSLGHGAFFALGGYAMGMYLMRQIGTRGVYGDPVLPDFMVFLNWKELPIYWYGFQHFAYAMLMVLLVPGRNLLGAVRNLSRSASVQVPPAFRSAAEYAYQSTRALRAPTMPCNGGPTRSGPPLSTLWQTTHSFSGPSAPTGIALNL